MVWIGGYNETIQTYQNVFEKGELFSVLSLFINLPWYIYNTFQIKYLQKQVGIKQPDKGSQHWINNKLVNTVSHQ